jgi:hypothetical protein
MYGIFYTLGKTMGLRTPIEGPKVIQLSMLTPTTDFPVKGGRIGAGAEAVKLMLAGWTPSVGVEWVAWSKSFSYRSNGELSAILLQVYGPFIAIKLEEG